MTVLMLRLKDNLSKVTDEAITFFFFLFFALHLKAVCLLRPTFPQRIICLFLWDETTVTASTLNSAWQQPVVTSHSCSCLLVSSHGLWKQLGGATFLLRYLWPRSPTSKEVDLFWNPCESECGWKCCLLKVGKTDELYFSELKSQRSSCGTSLIHCWIWSKRTFEDNEV